MRPRWLLNENFPMPSVRLLRSRGWDLIAIAETSPTARDPEVMACAWAEGRWLATFDRDYGELVFRRQLTPPPLVLLLRVSFYRAEQPAEWLESLCADELLIAGYFHLFDGKTVRRRLLPPSTGISS